MMLASGSTSWRTRLAASSTSHSVRSRPPVIDSSRLLAPFSVMSSSSGLTIASSAATIARCSPEASPVPIMAVPMPPSTVLHVGEIEVDEPLLDDQVDDAGDARIEHLVGQHEGFGEGRAVGGDAEQILIGNDEQRVDVPLQLGDADLGRAHAARAFEQERLGHDRHGQDAEFLGHAGDHRGRARAGAAAHAGGDEHHVAAGDGGADVLDRLLGGCLADFVLGAGAEAFGQPPPELDAVLGARGRQRLGIGVGDDELGARQPGRNHVVDGVAAGAADADHGDARFHHRVPFKSLPGATVPRAANTRLPPRRPHFRACPRSDRGRRE